MARRAAARLPRQLRSRLRRPLTGLPLPQARRRPLRRTGTSALISASTQPRRSFKWKRPATLDRLTAPAYRVRAG